MKLLSDDFVALVFCRGAEMMKMKMVVSCVWERTWTFIENPGPQQSTGTEIFSFVFGGREY